MKTTLLLLTLTLALAGCRFDDETLALEANAKEEQVWAFIQFNVPEEDDGLESLLLRQGLEKPLSVDQRQSPAEWFCAPAGDALLGR